MAATHDILAEHLADLEDDVLTGIIGSSTAQAAYLSACPATDIEARTMGTICGLIATAAETALLKRQTGITV